MHKSDTARPKLMDIPVALALLTRLPLPRLQDTAFARQALATWAFPLTGLVVATLACGIGWVALQTGLPTSVAAGLVLAAQIIATGAMHEDGLADTADGFWGGWDRDRRLEIMKDSAIGTYGVLALVLSVGVRWIALAQLLHFGFATVFAAAILSRATLPVLMACLPSARPNGLSHKVGVPPFWSVILSVGLGLFGAWLCVGVTSIFVALSVSVALFLLAVLAQRKIGGQTGDVLGAAQQVGEIVTLLVLLIVIAH